MRLLPLPTPTLPLSAEKLQNLNICYRNHYHRLSVKTGHFYILIRSGVRPTWLGAQKYKEAIKILHDINTVFSETENTSIRSSTIRLAVPGALTGLIAKPLAEFEKLQSSNHTRIEINSYQNINDIQPENFDLIVCLQMSG